MPIVTRHATPSHNPRTPEIIAIEQLAKMSDANAPTLKLVAAITGIVGDWQAEPISRGEVRDRIEKLREDVELGIKAAENL